MNNYINLQRDAYCGLGSASNEQSTLEVDIEKLAIESLDNVEKNIVALCNGEQEQHIYVCGFFGGYKAALSNTKSSSTWDEVHEQADHWLRTEHPIGKIIGYNHGQLMEYLKEHFNPPTLKQIP